MPEFYIGLDPGSNGGIAIITDDDATAFPMPATERDLWDALRPYGLPQIRQPNDAPLAFAVLEKVGGFVSTDYGRVGLGPVMFSFGRSYGSLYMCLIAAGIPFDLVTPQKWQKHFSLSKTKGESKVSWKGKLKVVAQRLFPGVKVTLATADALLLARYAQLQSKGVK